MYITRVICLNSINARTSYHTYNFEFVKVSIPKNFLGIFLNTFEYFVPNVTSMYRVYKCAYRT